MDDKYRRTKVDWDHWLNFPTVKLWQAVALSMNLAPEDEPWFGVLIDPVAGKLIGDGDKYAKRTALLTAIVLETDAIRIAAISGRNSDSKIYLDSFVDWALNTADWDIPKELATLVDPKNLPKEPEQEETELKEIYSWWNPKNREGIIKLFPLPGLDAEGNNEKWSKLFNKASQNGLSNAREGDTIQYNPVKVGDWLVERDYYTQQHVNGKLDNNLPIRSMNKRGLILGKKE